MNAFALAGNEFRCLMSNRLSVLAVLAVTITPLVYAGCYLYANQDPYGNLGKVPVAVVNLDDQAQDSSAGILASNLTALKALVSEAAKSEEVAFAGVGDQTYVFAVVIEEGFEEDLKKTDLSQGPRIRIITSSTSGFISQEISEKALETLKSQLIAQVNSVIVSNLLAGMSEIHEGITQATEGTEELLIGVDELSTGAAQIKDGLDLLDFKMASLLDGVDRLAVGSSEIAADNAVIAAIGDEVGTVADIVIDDFRAIRQPLLNLIGSSLLPAAERDLLAAIVQRIDERVARIEALIDNSASDLDRLAQGSAELSTGLAQLEGEAAFDERRCRTTGYGPRSTD
jgi:putative membrane protein